MKDCQFDVSPINYSDSDSEPLYLNVMCSYKGSLNNAYDTLNLQEQIDFIKGLTIVKALIL